MTLSLAQLFAWLEGFSWPFLRAGALLLAMPLFGSASVPVRVRVILAALIAILLMPLVALDSAPPLLSPAGFLVMAQQVMIGLAMGMVLQIMLAALVLAGQAVATSMGLGFASTIDPQNGVQVVVVGQFYMILATLLFVSMDGHLAALDVFAQSFQLFPVGGAMTLPDIFIQTAAFAGQMFVFATLIALPAMSGVLLVNLAFGVITRAAPQLNIFAMGFPLIMLAGFILMLLSLPVLMPLLTELFTTALEAVRFA